MNMDKDTIKNAARVTYLLGTLAQMKPTNGAAKAYVKHPIEK